MDPKAALLGARTALLNYDAEAAQAAVADYREWRARGGFEPTVTFVGRFEGGEALTMTGDDYAHELDCCLRRATAHVSGVGRKVRWAVADNGVGRIVRWAVA
jgi:hypothetical protein